MPPARRSAREDYERERARIRDEPWHGSRRAGPVELAELAEREREQTFEPEVPPTWHPGPRDFLGNPDSADMIFYAPPEDLVATPLHPNEGRKRRRRRALEHPTLELFGDWNTQLVRTALVRAEGYDPDDLPFVGSAEAIVAHCEHLKHYDQEYIVTFALDGRHRLMAIHEVGLGPRGHAATTPRDVLKVAFLTGAAAIVIVHNHPSGDPSPSPDDVAMTHALREAMNCVGIPFLDHIVVATKGWHSIPV